jgi:hypothetical protein
VLSYSAMRVPGLILAIVLIGFTCVATSQNTVVGERRQRAAAAFRDGILLFHASSELDLTADGFRQGPFFYYFTGLGNTVGAVLAIDGRSGESWLFLPSKPPFLRIGLQPEVQPGPEAAKRLGMEHVVDWSEFEGFLASHAGQAPPLYMATIYQYSPNCQPTFSARSRPKLRSGCRSFCKDGPPLKPKSRGNESRPLWQFRVWRKPPLCARLRRRL